MKNLKLTRKEANMNKDQLMTKLNTIINRMVDRYPDLVNYNLDKSQNSNELFKTDPIRYNVMFVNNPVIKYRKYTNVIREIADKAGEDIINVLKSYDLYSYVHKLNIDKPKRSYTKSW